MAAKQSASTAATCNVKRTLRSKRDHIGESSRGRHWEWSGRRPYLTAEPKRRKAEASPKTTPGDFPGTGREALSFGSRARRIESGDSSGRTRSVMHRSGSAFLLTLFLMLLSGFRPAAADPSAPPAGVIIDDF